MVLPATSVCRTGGPGGTSAATDFFAGVGEEVRRGLVLLHGGEVDPEHGQRVLRQQLLGGGERGLVPHGPFAVLQL